MSNVALPYPVLGRSDDYIGVDFQATLKVDDVELSNNEKYVIPYCFDLTDDAIAQQIEAGMARFGFEISCPGTSIRYVEFLDEVGELTIDPTLFFQKITFSPRVFVVDNITQFNSSNFNPEFANTTYDLEPGDFLATTEDDSINIDFKYLRFEDAIRVQLQPDLGRWVYTFGLEGESIIIGMGNSFFDFWSEAKHRNDLNPYLIMSVYKDCMMAALEHISSGIGDGSYAWERGLGEMLEEANIKIPENGSFSDLNLIAQQLMQDDGIKRVRLS